MSVRRLQHTSSMVIDQKAEYIPPREGGKNMMRADNTDMLMEALQQSKSLSKSDRFVETPISNFGDVLKQLPGNSLGAGTSGTAWKYSLTLPGKASKTVVVKVPNGNNTEGLMHEARIAHRLQDGAVWAQVCEPWVPLNVDGDKLRAIMDELHRLGATPGFGNIHHLIAFLDGRVFGPYGALVSTVAEGDLEGLIHQNRFGSDAAWAHAAKQLCDGMDYMHKLSVTHNDLKPENVFYTHTHGTLQLLIADFGSSTIVNNSGRCCLEHRKFCMGTFEAPEVKTTRYAADLRCADVFSACVALCDMALGPNFRRGPLTYLPPVLSRRVLPTIAARAVIAGPHIAARMALYTELCRHLGAAGAVRRAPSLHPQPLHPQPQHPIAHSAPAHGVFAQQPQQPAAHASAPAHGVYAQQRQPQRQPQPQPQHQHQQGGRVLREYG